MFNNDAEDSWGLVCGVDDCSFDLLGFDFDVWEGEVGEPSSSSSNHSGACAWSFIQLPYFLIL